jgi:hypothetical protein
MAVAPGAADRAVDVDLNAYWSELVTVALLGTDRRLPPPPVAGPLTSLALERPGGDRAAAMVDQVAALAVARRAGLRPLEQVAPLAPPAPDPRPECPSLAIVHHHEIVAAWPVLEDEWLIAVLEGGWRLAREQVVPLLVRHRSDPVRRRRVELAAGPIADWLVEHLAGDVPALAPVRRRRVDPAELDRAVTTLADLAVPPALTPLLAPPGDPEGLARLLLGPLRDGRLGEAHRAVLVHVVARLPRGQLAEVAEALDQVAEVAHQPGLVRSLAALAHLRHRMLAVLLPSSPDQPPHDREDP